MKKRFYSKEEIEKARDLDLLSYMRLYEPENLVKITGDVYTTREHDSLKISNGKWMWWSRGFGGVSALDYLVKVKDVSFSEAMEILIDSKASNPSFFMPSERKTKQRKLLLPERCESTEVIRRYLVSRCISENIITTLINKGLIYESLPYHSCVFIGKDDAGDPRYAFFRSCTKEKILGDAPGSDKSYPFRIEAPDSPVLHLFEGALDLLSYATLMELCANKWDEENLLSMGGIGVSKNGSIPIAIKRFLDENNRIKEIVIHFDNDNPGQSAAYYLKKTLETTYKVTNASPAYGKDYNEYLCILITGNEI